MKYAEQLLRVADRIERLSELTGRMVAWLTLAMVLVTVFVVTLRYLFDKGFIWLQESVVWMHALVFLLAAAYTLAHDEHVRVDIFYRRMSPRGRALVDLFGTMFLLVPSAVFILVTSLDFIVPAWRVGESSPEAGGLPGLYMLKTVIPVMAVLLLLQALAWALRSLIRLLDPARVGVRDSRMPKDRI
jgi:TRAP-type mannitol/chloroaromatic compound transport system permease small subunit